ncbi:class I SAM-dependent methyltransferase [Candidatus Woesearchaeota archaeon]|nr:class I SAM-dependent methyltransferase [Candidatus Woesearchaeota archaeon]
MNFSITDYNLGEIGTLLKWCFAFSYRQIHDLNSRKLVDIIQSVFNMSESHAQRVSASLAFLCLDEEGKPLCPNCYLDPFQEYNEKDPQFKRTETFHKGVRDGKYVGWVGRCLHVYSDSTEALDLGAGAGAYLIDLFRMGFKPTGVENCSDHCDIRPTHPVQALQKLGMVKFETTNAQGYVASQPSSRYTLISVQKPSGILTLLCVPNDASQAFLSDIHRILTPGGVFELVLFGGNLEYTVKLTKQNISKRGSFQLIHEGVRHGTELHELIYRPI